MYLFNMTSGNQIQVLVQPLEIDKKTHVKIDIFKKLKQSIPVQTWFALIEKKTQSESIENKSKTCLDYLQIKFFCVAIFSINKI